jgi:phosphoglycerol transferase MdoB-like AlkP superfamily enzyme
MVNANVKKGLIIANIVLFIFYGYYLYLAIVTPTLYSVQILGSEIPKTGPSGSDFMNYVATICFLLAPLTTYNILSSQWLGDFKYKKILIIALSIVFTLALIFATVATWGRFGIRYIS